jgi:hypothetical protein
MARAMVGNSKIWNPWSVIDDCDCSCSFTFGLRFRFVADMHVSRSSRICMNCSESVAMVIIIGCVATVSVISRAGISKDKLQGISDTFNLLCESKS